MRKVICAGCIEQFGVDDTTFYRNKRWCYSPECKDVIDEKVKNMNFVRRVKKIEKGKFRNGVSQHLRSMILTRDRNQCNLCYLHSESIGVLQVHHITPVSKGGDDSSSNLITLCKPCHAKVHNKGWEKYVGYFQKNIKEVVELDQGRLIQFPLQMG